ncbi:MAG: AgmX/PglI C-terminal domain-containing protein [Bdellovibrionota bacterium]
MTSRQTSFICMPARNPLLLIFLLLTLVGASQALLGCAGIGEVPDASMGESPTEGPVGRTMQGNAEKFVSCARDSVSIQTGTTQNIQLKFQIDPEGKVIKAQIDQMSAPDPDLYSCVLKRLKKITFPAPVDRKSRAIRYPLVLRPE